MSFSDWIPWTSVFGITEDVNKAHAANDKLIELNQQAYADGRISFADYQGSAARLGADAQTFTVENSNAQIDQAFQDGLENPAKKIPWWVWALAIGALVIYLAPLLTALASRRK